MKKFCSLIASVLVASSSLQSEAQDYTNGVYVLNEDWYGHNNSSLNFWNPETELIDYYIMQMANNYEYSLGCTSQYGQLYGDFIVITAKQDKDPGEPGDMMSGRVAILHKNTLKPVGDEVHPLISVNENDKSDADGRGVCFVDNKKFYVGTSNGIYVFKWNEQGEIFTWDSEKIIPGTDNPLITGNEVSNADGQGPLYKNQIGMMLRTQDYVFAIKQDLGVLVIDPETDEILKIIEGCFSTMVQSKDGNVWVGVNYQEEGYEDNLKYPYGWNGDAWNGTQLMCIDQYTLETKKVRIDTGGVPQSWYAWTAGTLTASNTENVLYFVYTDPSLGQINWFRNCVLYRFNIDAIDWDNIDLANPDEAYAEGACEEIYDSSFDGLYFYGGAIQCNPKDGNIYASLYVEENIATQDWIYAIINSEGEMIQYQEPIKRYWYPAMFIFPDNEAPIVEDIEDVTIEDENPVEITLADKVTDDDSNNAAIIKSISNVENSAIVKADIVRGNLVLTPLNKGNTIVEIAFNSNGKIVTKSVAVSVTAEISSIQMNTHEKANVFAVSGNIMITGIDTPQQVEIFNAQGSLVKSIIVNNGEQITGLAKGNLYLVKISNQSYKIVL
ncbi:MAG: DUF5074 domain-containing protein [Muribaculaceae bacterium]|nr:DUF5074 domain-containing protein [Muribaculaceae bacterium]